MSLGDELRAADEIAELRQALQRTQRSVARAKARTDDLVDAVYRAALDAALAVGHAKPAAAHNRDRRKSKGEIALVHATDWQLGKRTAGYSIETCANRIDQLAGKVIELTEIQRAHHPVRHCQLLLGGDMVEGITIFPGQAWEVEAHLFEQLFETARIIERLTLTLLEHFETVSVACEYGNHGRIGRKGENPAGDNIDRMAYRIAADRLRDQKRISSWQESSNWYQIVDIGNYRALLVHGDEINSFGGNTPAFGILRKCNAWATGVVPRFDDVYMGHWHTPMSLTLANGGRVFVTGSPESDNVYAAEFVAARGRPSQRLHFVDPEKARVTAEYVVYLD